MTRDEIEEDGTHWRIVYSVKVTSWVVISISTMWLLFALVLGHMLVVGIAGAVLLGTFFSLFLVLAGYPVMGRVAWYLISIIAVTFAVFTVHPVGHAEALYVALLGGPFLTFSVQTERRYIMVWCRWFLWFGWPRAIWATIISAHRCWMRRFRPPMSRFWCC